jgi:chromosomal replication initiator protein
VQRLWKNHSIPRRFLFCRACKFFYASSLAVFIFHDCIFLFLNALFMDLWKSILCSIAKRVNQQSFDTWFAPIQFHSHQADTLKLRVPNEYFRTALLEHFSQVFRDVLAELNQDQSSVSFVIDDTTPRLEPVLPKPAAESSLGSSGNLNPNYIFDSFVVATSNQFAHAASRAVAENPARAYNPFYIYGGAGLGKTHLMHSIGHHIRIHNPRLRLAYVPTESFTNDLITSLRNERMPFFRELYRNIDVLLMDDIQFLAGKESTQQEFFHTFNSLYDAQKQIVIASDCLPKEIPTLEERLHSRFEWGLIADIQPPDLETKIAILKKKAAAESIEIPDDVAFFIANNIKSDIRVLEGSLRRLIGYSSLTGAEMDLALAHQVLSNIVRGESRILSPELILKAVADHFNMKPAILKSRNNSRSIAEPRQIAMYLCKQLTDCSLPSIGKAFGGKHHTTVLHSIRKVASDRRKKPEVDSIINKISAQFQ